MGKKREKRDTVIMIDKRKLPTLLKRKITSQAEFDKVFNRYCELNDAFSWLLLCDEYPRFADHYFTRVLMESEEKE